MFPKTNIEKQLFKSRAKRIEENAILKEVEQLFNKNEQQREKIKSTLNSKSQEVANKFDLNQLNAAHIFHINDIKNLCVNYRLRFLDSHYFKGEIPPQAISEIRELEQKHDISIKNFKIVAPAKLLKLENADDPLLFAPIGNDYFYLIYKWGNDLHPFRKLLMWPYKNFDNLVLTVVALSVFLTAITPMHLLTPNATIGEYIFLAFFIFIGMGGMVILYGFSHGKNFNSSIWNSKFYNG